jgi:hypothetical protein
VVSIGAMGTRAVFPKAPAGASMYESFYLRAVSPDQPLGVWIRYTVHKGRGRRPKGSLWCTVFDGRRGRPLMDKLTTEELGVPEGGWIEVGGGRLTPAGAEGRSGAAGWLLGFASDQDELRHLPRRWLYRTALPRTKLTSPLPAARFHGTVQISGGDAIALEGWPGMVGHNWGSEHAERWIWLHGIGFEEQPEAWLDLALGRVKIAGRMTPWVANGMLSLDGRRHRLGGLIAHRLHVDETPGGCAVTLAGEGGLRMEVRAEAPDGTAAGWHYADPGDEDRGHDVMNCSIASLELAVRLPGTTEPRTLRTGHGGAYELGMRERDHGVPIAPFSDG